jgi:ADP-heptose:LPS heptosyltransferase
VFNLVDIHLGVAGLPHAGIPGKLNIPEDLTEEYRKSLENKTRKQASALHTNGTKRIAIQLGANSPRRQWNVDKFAEVTNRLASQCKVEVVLVGSNKEAGLGDEFCSLVKHSVYNYIGKTSLVELAALLSTCDLLLSGDTGTLHLAAALGLPSVSIFLGAARAIDTAPYLAGCSCLEPATDCYPCGENTPCSHFDCHNSVTPDQVVDAALECGSLLPQKRITGFDTDGFLTVESTYATVSNEKVTRLQRLWKTRLQSSGGAQFDELIQNSLNSLLEAATV